MTDEHVALVAPIFERRGIERQDLHTTSETHDDVFDKRAQESERQEQCSELDEVYAKQNNNWVQDLVSVVQHGNVQNTFHWKPSKGVGMLESVERMITERYGEHASAEHRSLLRRISAEGTPRHWALMWIFILSIDTGLQQYVTSAEVRSYVGTDGVCKQPSDAHGLFYYLHSLRAAMYDYAMKGLQDPKPLMEAVTTWHVFGGQKKLTTVLP